MTSTAYLLISHGSRDPRHQIAINRLAQLVRERLNPSLLGPWSQSSSSSMVENHSAMKVLDATNNGSLEPKGRSAALTTLPRVVTARLPRDRFIVGTAVLDFGLLPLHQQICEFGRRLTSAGIERLQLVPLFLLRGKHVIEDIPEEVNLARKELDGMIDLEIGEHIGGSQGMFNLLTHRFSHSPSDGRLIVAHGSRRVKGNQMVNNLAKSLGTSVAYWTKESDIEKQTIQLMQQGCSMLTIFPYFLFAGGITDAVAHLTEELAERFPRTSFRLLPPLGATADMADLIVRALGHNSRSSGVAKTERYIF